MSRLIMPFPEWPAVDKERWIAARFKGTVLDSRGLAADWSALTVKQDMKAYGLWLQYLANIGELNSNASPGQRLTKSNLNGFAHALSRRVSPETTAGRLSTLGRMIRVLDFDADRSWLLELQRRYAKRARPCRNKQPKMFHPATILRAVIAELDREMKILDPRPRKELTRFR